MIFLWRLHVWSNFCLCYNDRKLVSETECIKNYGIKDGDQVVFGFPSCSWNMFVLKILSAFFIGNLGIVNCYKL